MKRIILLSLSIPLILLSPDPALSQTAPQNTLQPKLTGDAAETLWKLHISSADFQNFLSKNPLQLQKAKGRFFYETSKGIIRANNTIGYFEDMKNTFIPLYSALKKNTPSPQNPALRNQQNLPVTQSTCTPFCDNIGFQNGTLSAWSSYYGINSSNTSFVISSITGGPSGTVIKSAFDPNITPVN